MPKTFAALASPQQHPPLTWSRMASPIGDLLLVGREDCLVGLFVADHESAPVAAATWAEDDSAFTEARRQLEEYFAGTRTTFDLPME